MLRVSALFEKKKPGFLWRCCATKIPANSQMITFWKLYIKSGALFEISEEIKKGAANIFVVSGWTSSRGVSNGVCIYGDVKNRVHILPSKVKLIYIIFSIITKKKHFRCNFFQVASKVLGKHGGTGQIWTGEWEFCRHIDNWRKPSWYQSLFDSLTPEW